MSERGHRDLEQLVVRGVERIGNDDEVAALEPVATRMVGDRLVVTGATDTQGCFMRLDTRQTMQRARRQVDEPLAPADRHHFTQCIAVTLVHRWLLAFVFGPESIGLAQRLGSRGTLDWT